MDTQPQDIREVIKHAYNLRVPTIVLLEDRPLSFARDSQEYRPYTNTRIYSGDDLTELAVNFANDDKQFEDILALEDNLLYEIRNSFDKPIGYVVNYIRYKGLRAIRIEIHLR